MEEPGKRLRQARERLNLRYRDVAEASQRLADKYSNGEYAIGLSRLSEIENGNTIPSIYRLYALCAIYRLSLTEVLEWYGIRPGALAADALSIEHAKTHLVDLDTHGEGSVTVPLALDPGLDLRRSTYLSRMIQRWGKLPLLLLEGLDTRRFRYALVGTDDWSMHPILPPGSLVVIDESRRRVQTGGWSTAEERPIYFLEHRDGYVFGWCSIQGDQLVVLPHPASASPPEVYRHPGVVEIVGQVTGVAMRLDQARRRPNRP